MSDQATTRGPRLATWPPAVSSVLLFLIFIALAAHVRIGLGHWPAPMVENYQTPAYRVHEMVFGVVGFFTVFAAIPVWFLLLCFQPLRISAKTHMIQAGVYLIGWGLIVLYAKLDPGQFVTWFLD